MKVTRINHLAEDEYTKVMVDALRKERLDNAVRQVFGLYESEWAYGMARLKLLCNLLQMRLKHQTMDDMDHRLLERMLREIWRAYYAG